MTRISDIHRRTYTPEQTSILCDELTDALRTEWGTMRLFPLQAQALWDAYTVGGLFGQLKVGKGKTLVSGLLPLVLGAQRPVLIVPGALREKTHKDFDALRLHWQIPRHITVESYETLALAKNAGWLQRRKPDLLILDEAHRCKHAKSAAVPKRVERYLQEFPACRVAVLSGTLTQHLLHQYSHLLVWSLRELAPVPLRREDQEQWSHALTPTSQSPNVSTAIFVPHFGNCGSLGVAREKFQRRLVETPGVIIDTEDTAEGMSLTVSPIEVPTPAHMEPHFENLRKLWLCPDGFGLGDAKIGVWAVARQLATGFYYRHDPRPPADWMAARREWSGFCRRIITTTEYDTELAVANACDNGALPAEILQAWRAIKPTFTPNTVVEWLSDHVLQRCMRWGEQRDSGASLIWCEYTEFAKALAKLTGWPYYGAQGICKETNTYIEQHPGNAPAIVSVAANATGRNLQYKFHRNLIVDTFPTVSTEQLLGRTHRTGQEADEVTVDYLVACAEHIGSFYGAIEKAQSEQETSGTRQKLLYCTLLHPTSPKEAGAAFKK